MTTSQIADIFGYIAAGIGIFTFLPQAIRIWKTKNTKAISFTTYSFLAASSICWITYGILMKTTPLLVVNAVLLVVSLFILSLKRKYG